MRATLAWLVATLWAVVALIGAIDADKTALTVSCAIGSAICLSGLVSSYLIEKGEVRR